MGHTGKLTVGAVIMAGGTATRLGARCGKVPKSMLRFDGVPFLDYLMGYALRCSLAPICVAGGHLGHVIAEHYCKHPWNEYPIETHICHRLGTGGDLLAVVESMPCQHIVVMNADTVVHTPLELAIRQHIESGADCTIVLSQRHGLPNERAFLVGHNGRVMCSLEARVCAPLPCGRVHWRGSSTGVMVFSVEALLMLSRPGPVSLEADLLPDLIAQGDVRAFDNGDRYVMDYGTPERLRGLLSDPSVIREAYGPPFPGQEAKE